MLTQAGASATAVQSAVLAVTVDAADAGLLTGAPPMPPAPPVAAGESSPHPVSSAGTDSAADKAKASLGVQFTTPRLWLRRWLYVNNLNALCRRAGPRRLFAMALTRAGSAHRLGALHLARLGDLDRARPPACRPRLARFGWPR